MKSAALRTQLLEVMDDSQHLHSAPDTINREALWRFM
jgi:hypothetical protein